MVNPEPFHPALVTRTGGIIAIRLLPMCFFINVRLARHAQQVTVTIRQKMLPCRA